MTKNGAELPELRRVIALSEPRLETNGSGHTVWTEWFDDARMEWHPDKPNEYQVLLGLLGNLIGQSPANRRP